MGLEPEQEVTVTPPTQPESVHKAVVQEVTDNTCIVKYNVATDIQVRYKNKKFYNFKYFLSD